MFYSVAHRVKNMRISHKHKFIFISTPKTGSESVRAALNQFSDIQSSTGMYAHHKTYDQILMDFNYAKDYISFGFARNPWGRCVSHWFHIKKHAQNNKHDYGNRCRQILKTIFHFEDYLLSENTLRPCFNWLSSNNLDIDVHFFGKLETIQEDFDTICDKIGIPQQQLPHKNKINHKHYNEYYDDETRSIVAEKYAKDIEYFGYEFGE